MEVPDYLTPCPIMEAMTTLNERSSLGRVVVNPPGRMAPLKLHETGEVWYICDRCSFACTTSEKMIQHHVKHDNEPTPVAFSDDDSEDSSSGTDDDDDQELDIEIESDDEEGHTLEFKDDIINKKKDYFKCHICHKLLVTLKGLRNHHLVHASHRPFRCHDCGASFKIKSYLSKHVQASHNESFNYKCQRCPCRFEKHQGLRKHMSFYHDTTISQTQIEDDQMKKCKTKSPTSKPQLIVPILQGRKQMIAKLPKKTGKLFSNENSIRTISKAYKRNLVKKMVLKAIEQNSKITDKVPLACGTCGKQFSTKQTLRKHERGMHTDDKVYECDLCGIRFVSSLRKHKQCAHGDGTFHCKYCTCRFRTKGFLTRHNHTHHLEESILDD